MPTVFISVGDDWNDGDLEGFLDVVAQKGLGGATVDPLVPDDNGPPKLNGSASLNGAHDGGPRNARGEPLLSAGSDSAGSPQQASPWRPTATA